MRHLIKPWMKVAARNMKRVTEEFFYFFIFGLMPVWLGAVFSILSGNNPLSYLGSYLIDGEALVICTTTIGPLIFMITEEYNRNSEGFSKSFPGRRIFIACITVICLLAAGVSGFQESISKKYSIDAMWWISSVVTLFALVIWILATAIKNSMESGATKIMRQDTDDFLVDWSRR